MRWARVIMAAAGFAGLAGALALREPEGLGQCNKSCLPEKRDASGCCPAPAKQKPTPTPTAAPQPQSKPAPKACPEGMVLILAGSFLMGSPEGVGGDNEHSAASGG